VQHADSGGLAEALDDVAEDCLTQRTADQIAYLQDGRLVASAHGVVGLILARVAFTAETGAGVVLPLGEVLADHSVPAHKTKDQGRNAEAPHENLRVGDKHSGLHRVADLGWSRLYGQVGFSGRVVGIMP
jgi:hypothetical protein